MSQRKNATLALNLLAVVAGMLMLAYASVPLYKLFCELTGYGGTTKSAAAAPGAVSDRTITVKFNADTDPSLPWEFRPLQKSLTVRVGEQSLAHYEAHNLTGKPISGHAVFNVVPFSAGSYFVKIECFCFQEQTLKPGERVNMPVLFYIDPKILEDRDMDAIKTITLSYTFFSVKKEPSKSKE